MPEVDSDDTRGSREANPAETGDRSNAFDPIASPGDVVEGALADAIQKAAAAGAFEVLPKLVAELEARRKARLAVVDLASERAKRGRS